MDKAHLCLDNFENLQMMETAPTYHLKTYGRKKASRRKKQTNYMNVIPHLCLRYPGYKNK